MKDSDKGFFSSSTKFSTTGGTDENAENCDKMASKLHNPLKKPPMKHFMSPTISATSKAFAPRKKILAERNEALNSTETHHNNTLNLDSKASPLRRSIDSSNRYWNRVTPVQSWGSESDDDELNTCVSASKASAPRKKILAERNKTLNYPEPHDYNTPNLDSKTSPLCSSDRHLIRAPGQSRGFESDDDEQNTRVSGSSFTYDPLFNYLSPRPKFLRYKPNRRREIFLGLENENGEEKDGSGVKSSVRLDSQRGFVKQEGEKNVTENEQDEGSGVKTSACLVSQRNIFEEEKITSSQEGIVDKRDEMVNELNHQEDDSDEEIEENEQDEWSGVKSSACLVSQRTISEEEKITSSQEGIVDKKDEMINELNRDHPDDDSDEEIEEFEKENHSIVKEVLKFLLVLGILFLSTFYICSMNSPSPSLTPQAFWSLKDGYHQIQNHTSEVADFVEGKSVSLVQRERIQFSSNVCFEEEATTTERNIKEMVESTDELVEVADVKKTEKGKDGYDAEVEREEEVSVGFPPEENAESEEALKQLKGIELSETAEKSESLQVKGEDKIGTIEGIFDNGAEKEVVDNKMESLEESLTHIEDDISQGEVDTVMGFLIVLVISALSLLGFLCWRKKTSGCVEKHLSKSVLAEKTTSVGPVVLPYVEEEHVDKVESFVDPSSFLRSTEETPKQFYRIRAPMVELLGEYVVGEVSSSIKSCGMTSNMMEIEVSSNSVFQETAMGSKAHAFSSPVKLSASEFSTMNSPSYGSFTAEKKISQKKENKGGEMKSVPATPVRRSSRLRNRAVTSP